MATINGPNGAKDREDAQAPDFGIDALVRCLLPKIQAYFESPEGQAEFEAWKQKQHNADT